MEKPVATIPGYYYDNEKKKYFKIQASSAGPASSAYSSLDVKRRETRDRLAETKKLKLARQKGRIRGPRVLESPLAGDILKREHGRERDIDTAKIFAAGLKPQGRLSSLAQVFGCVDPLFLIDHRPDLGDSVADVSLAYSAQLINVRINVDDHAQVDENFQVNIYRRLANHNITFRNSQNELFSHPGMATSLTVHEETRRLAMTWLSGSPHSGIGIASLPNEDMAESSMPPSVMIGPGTVRGPEVSIFTSAAAPSVSSKIFACGTSSGILTVDKSTLQPRWLPSGSSHPGRYSKDILALEYLQENPSILLSGSRNGILNIIDERVPLPGPEADTITHPSTITHIKQLDTHRILVAGLNSSLNQYDLRFRKVDAPEPSHNLPSRKKQKLLSQRNRIVTRSPLSYPDFHNSVYSHIGFDVDLESGIIAAAQDPELALNLALDSPGLPVRLFSLHGGNILPGLRWNAKTSLQDPFRYGQAPPQCVRWGRDVTGMMKALYVGMRDDVLRFAWQGDDGDDGRGGFDLLPPLSPDALRQMRGRA